MMYNHVENKGYLGATCSVVLRLNMVFWRLSQMITLIIQGCLGDSLCLKFYCDCSPKNNPNSLRDSRGCEAYYDANNAQWIIGSILFRHQMRIGVGEENGS